MIIVIHCFNVQWLALNELNTIVLWQTTECRKSRNNKKRNFYLISFYQFSDKEVSMKCHMSLVTMYWFKRVTEHCASIHLTCTQEPIPSNPTTTVACDECQSETISGTRFVKLWSTSHPSGFVNKLQIHSYNTLQKLRSCSFLTFQQVVSPILLARRTRRALRLWYKDRVSHFHHCLRDRKTTDIFDISWRRLCCMEVFIVTRIDDISSSWVLLRAVPVWY